MPQRQRESVRLPDEYWRTQARIGAGVSAQALAQWSRVSPTSLTVSGAAWLTAVLSLIRLERSRSREAAAAWYRLHRAVETGTTLPPLDGANSESVTLGELRDDWAQHADSERTPQADDSESVQVDDFSWPDVGTDAMDEAARTSLIVTGPVRAQQAIDQEPADDGRGRLDSAEFLRELDTSMSNAGAASAGAADREALRGGRELVRAASRADTRVIGWARVTDGDPCDWCAMLASRGAVYRSRDVAGIRGRTGRTLPPVQDPEDLEKYHNMCHCQTIPVYSRSAQLPESSERFARDWPRVTRGLAGAEARAAWRRHISARRRG